LKNKQSAISNQQSVVGTAGDWMLNGKKGSQQSTIGSYGLAFY
jgi:hypothetical protein